MTSLSVSFSVCLCADRKETRDKTASSWRPELSEINTGVASRFCILSRIGKRKLKGREQRTHTDTERRLGYLSVNKCCRTTKQALTCKLMLTDMAIIFITWVCIKACFRKKFSEYNNIMLKVLQFIIFW